MRALLLACHSHGVVTHPMHLPTVLPSAKHGGTRKLELPSS